MLYTDRFISTDDLIRHLSSVLPQIRDNFLLSKYAGFLSVSAVTVYELAIKDIFIEFATRKHQAYGSYVENKFERINGRIKLSDLRKEHVKSFGTKYLTKFENNMDTKEENILRLHRYSIKASYSNLITCRHSFVHEGQATLSASEVINSYERGKEILRILHESMRR